MEKVSLRTFYVLDPEIKGRRQVGGLSWVSFESIYPLSY